MKLRIKDTISEELCNYLYFLINAEYSTNIIEQMFTVANLWIDKKS